MLNNLRLRKRLLPALSLFLLGQASFANIYRPVDEAALIAAINSANASTGDDIIDLRGRNYKYFVSCDSLMVPPANCTGINGPNALPSIVSAATAGKLSIINGRIERAPDAVGIGSEFRLLEVQAGGDLTLFNITLENGHLVVLTANSLAQGPGILANSDNGGAIFNAGSLVLQNSTLYNNVANDLGGAIYNAPGATLDIQSSDIINNTALNALEGIGGGGGIFNADGALIDSIDNSNISNNITPGFGAGINNQGEARNIFSSTIASNYSCTSVDGGVCPDGEPTASGGGIYNATSAVILQLVNVTIANNVAYQGGGIYNDSEGFLPFVMDDIPAPFSGVYIYNSTITGNIASQGGGGIYNNNNNGDGNVAVINELVSTIVAGNTDNQEISLAAPDIQNFDGTVLPATIIVAANNLISNNQGVTSITETDNIAPIRQNNIVGTVVAPINPLLAALDYNGGFTQTVAILPGSPAKDNGLNPYQLIYDQREKPYRRVACSLPDIGAYELQNCFADNQ